jgi:hypothetical protein
MPESDKLCLLTTEINRARLGGPVTNFQFRDRSLRYFAIHFDRAIRSGQILKELLIVV